MAVSRGQKSTEGAVRKFYVGVGSSYILAVCPTKAELEKIYGRTQDSDPEYLTFIEDGDEKIPQIKLDFIVKPNPAKYLDNQGIPIEAIIHAPIFLKKRYAYGTTSNKYQIIDKYGRTAWATEEQIRNREIPTYKDKDGNEFQARISPDYVVAYEGLEELTKLIREYLVIPSVEKWEKDPATKKNRYVGLIDNPAEAEVMPDHIEDLFKGNVSEIKEIFGYQPENEVKLPYYMRNAADGKQYQGVYTKMPMKNAVTNYSKLVDEVVAAQNRGALPNCEFDFGELHEYVVTPTTFAPTNAPMPGTAAFGQTPW